MISLNNITVRFGAFELFSGITFMIDQRDRIGLVGKNGAGKSTLLKLISGEFSPSEGNISKPSEINIGYLPQQLILQNNSNSVIEEAKLAFSEFLKLQKELDELNLKISSAIDFEDEEYLKAIERISFLTEHLSIHGLNSIEADTEKVLKGLGFSAEDLNRKVTEFSGGWRMRIELAKILLKNPDLLLLDEPTNHLDIEAIQWLEEFIAEYRGAVVVISHDRAFLDNVTTRTIELNLGKIYDYKVSYSQFKELQQERIKQQLASYENQQKLIKDTEEFIERFRYKATKANQVQSRIKQLEKLEIIEVDELDNSRLNIKFAPAPRSGDVVVETKDLTKYYGNKLVLKDINLIVERGEKVAFVGRNGEGKTTLSRIITGELDYDGVLKIGHNVKIGYFAQNQDELLSPELTVFETLDRVAVGDIRTKLRDILGAFLFSGEDIEKKVKVLSGGEQSRLSLAKLLLEPYNLLVLDEPTNHLDMRSKDILKDALKKFDGTLILVSHDRYFLDGLVEKIYEFKNHKIYQHIGGIYDFIKKRKIEDLKELEYKEKTNTLPKKETISENKKNYLEKKEFDKRKRQLKSKIEKSEDTIHQLETELETLKAQLNTTVDSKKIEELYKQFSELEKQLEKEMLYWESLITELEDFENKFSLK
ncbi:MAG: ABC-F family ATP-binding cassette domain-containing protein [Bacteroidales bacterium]|nr:ABC-F family ATP-binding cassette domain-containing protein [Bacteroidales bacterium]